MDDAREAVDLAAFVVDDADALPATAAGDVGSAAPLDGASLVLLDAEGNGVAVLDASGWVPARLMLIASTTQPTTAATDVSDDATRPRDMWPVCQV